MIIATADSNIGMGGPAMIEGGGLGVFAPGDIGGMDVQVPNGVVDIAVSDETEAIEEAKRYLSYFQGTVADWEAPDQRRMRHIVPENRLRVYQIREVIETIADVGSVLELRPGFGFGMVTSLIRIEGRRSGWSRTTRCISVARSTPMPPTRAHDHADLRCVRYPGALPLRHAGHHGRPSG